LQCRRNFGGGAVPLYFRRNDEHTCPAPTALEHLQKIAYCRSRGTSDKTNAPGKRRKRPFARRIEEPFGCELLTQLPQRQFQRTDAPRLNLFNHELILAARGVKIDVPPADHLQSVMRLEAQPTGRGSPNYRLHLGLVVF
jgi:hypothetical protein